MGFYTNGDPYSYQSLEQHAAQLTHVCPEWFALVDGLGQMRIDADVRLPKLAAAKGFALMPLLTNLVGDTWQPEAVENLAHGPADRQDRFIQNSSRQSPGREGSRRGRGLGTGRSRAYRDDITKLLNKMAGALHAADRELWLCVQPGQDLDYIDFDNVSETVDRFVALLFDETSDTETPGPLASRRVVRIVAARALTRRGSETMDLRAGQLRLRLDERRASRGADQFSRGDEPRELRGRGIGDGRAS